MDEAKSICPQPAETPSVRDPVHFSVKDWVALGMALALSWLYWRIFGLENLGVSLIFNTPPGLGIPVFVFALFTAVFVYLGKHVRRTTPALLLTGCALTLSLSCCLCANYAFVVLNCFVILGVSVLAIFTLSGHLHKSWRDCGILPESAGLAFLSLFSHIGKPFCAFGTLCGTEKKRFSGIAAGLLVALPVLLLVISLLTSADAVFDSLFAGLGEALARLNLSSVLWRILRVLILGLLFFSALHFLPRPRTRAEKVRRETRAAQSMPYITVLVLLDAVYLVFTAIQFAFLFGGAETAAMHGGYAEYARNGFFQLVAVTVINLAAALLPQLRLPENRPIKLLTLFLLLCTAVILVSAGWRMALYISVYGLSLLRLLTLWGMLVIAVCIGAAAYKLLHPQFRFFQVFFAFALGSWLLLSCLRPDVLIANYNVDAYLDGRVEQVDTAYLSYLSPNALPALERLRDAGTGPASLDADIAALQTNAGSALDAWTCWRP